MTRTCLYEAANALTTRKLGGSGLRAWALAIANRPGPRKAKGGGYRPRRMLRAGAEGQRLLRRRRCQPA